MSRVQKHLCKLFTTIIMRQVASSKSGNPNFPLPAIIINLTLDVIGAAQHQHHPKHDTEQWTRRKGFI